MEEAKIRKIDYDSPLKYFDFLTFEDFSIDEDVCDKKQEYRNIKAQIQHHEASKQTVEPHKINLKGVIQSLNIRKAESHDKMIDFLFHGLPRCYLDSKLFDFCFINKQTFDKIFHTYMDFQIISKVNCVIGTSSLAANDGVGEYYIIQSYKNAKQCSVLKKVIINWKAFDPSFFIFRKLNYLNIKGSENAEFSTSINDLDYYLNIWQTHYLKHEIYYLKYLVHALQNTHYQNTKFYLFNKIKLEREIKHQKKQLNTIFESSKNSYIFECNQVKFYWHKEHVRKYYSSVSFENPNEFKNLESVKTYTLRNNPFKEQTLSNFKISTVKENTHELFGNKKEAEETDIPNIAKDTQKSLEKKLEKELLTKNKFAQCQLFIAKLNKKDKFKSRSNFLKNVLEAENKLQPGIDYQTWSSDFAVFTILILNYLIKSFSQKKFSEDIITYKVTANDKENEIPVDDLIKFETVKTYENDLIDEIVGSEGMAKRMSAVNKQIYALWKYLL